MKRASDDPNWETGAPRWLLLSIIGALVVSLVGLAAHNLLIAQEWVKAVNEHMSQASNGYHRLAAVEVSVAKFGAEIEKLSATQQAQRTDQLLWFFEQSTRVGDSKAAGQWGEKLRKAKQ